MCDGEIVKVNICPKCGDLKISNWLKFSHFQSENIGKAIKTGAIRINGNDEICENCNPDNLYKYSFSSPFKK